jgi:hypothetical protein
MRLITNADNDDCACTVAMATSISHLLLGIFSI